MKRIAQLMSLLLVLAFTLTGCNLIAVDEVAVIHREMDATRKTYTDTVMAEYDGGKLTMENVVPSFYYNYNYMSQLYSQFGMPYTLDAASEQEMVQNATENEIQNIAIERQFEARGLTTSLTEEEIEAEADQSWNADLENAMSYAEGRTEEVKRANAEKMLLGNGLTEEVVKNSTRTYYKAQAVTEAVRGEVTEVSEEDLQAAYDALVEEDEANYSENPNAIENDASDTSKVIAWYPEGYRTVKHILVKPEDDVMQAVNTARDALKTAESELSDLETELTEAGGEIPAAIEEEPVEEEPAAEEPAAEETAVEEAVVEETTEEPTEAPTEEPTVEEKQTAKFGVAYAEEAETTEETRSIEEITADYVAKQEEIKALRADVEAAEAALIASLQDKLDEIYAKLDAGESFDSVMAEYGEDNGMKTEPTMTDGYYVSANSTRWDANFTAAAMALNAVGDYSAESDVAISSYGVHIMYYNSDVTPGKVPLETIHDALYDKTLEEAKDAHYDEELASWVDAMNVTYHYENWKSVLA